MVPQPNGEIPGGDALEEVQGNAPFQVYHQGAVGPPFSKGKLVYSQDLGQIERELLPALQPEQRVGTGDEPQESPQEPGYPGPQLGAAAVGQLQQRVSGPPTLTLGLPRVATQGFGEGFDKYSLLPLRAVAEKAAGLDNQLHRPTKPRRVQSLTPVTAVDTPTAVPTSRAGNPGTDRYQVEGKSVPLHRHPFDFPLRRLGTYRLLPHDTPPSTHPPKGSGALRLHLQLISNYHQICGRAN